MAKDTVYKTSSELAAELKDGEEYTRQEVAKIVGCGWANVLEASRQNDPDAPLRGTLKSFGGTSALFFTKEAIVAWRASVEARKSTSGKKVIISINSESDLNELKSLLAGSKFAKYVG